MTELSHGYTMAEVDRLARSAAGCNYTMAADYRDLVYVAWNAIVDLLVTAEHRPQHYDLARAGKAAIWQLVRDHRQTHGYRDRKWEHGPASAPRFQAFWWDFLTVIPGHENAVVERHAVAQVLAACTAAERRGLLAVAACDGDRDKAAAVCGVRRRTLDQLLLTGRRRCLALWLEGETPVRVRNRRPDKRRSLQVAPCGTLSAVHRHHARRERMCDLCAPVSAAYDRDRKAARVPAP